MKKKKLFMTLLKSNTLSTPSEKAKAEAALHFVLNVQNSGTEQTSQF